MITRVHSSTVMSQMTLTPRCLCVISITRHRLFMSGWTECAVADISAAANSPQAFLRVLPLHWLRLRQCSAARSYLWDKPV
jgi:hypothetical protein